MKRALCVGFAVVMIGVFGVAWAAKKEKAPVSKKQADTAIKAVVSGDQVKTTVSSHIDIVSLVNKGSYPIYDNQESKQLQLKFVKFHDERVNRFKKEDAYIVCAVFSADDKTKYDIDFWVKQDASGKLEVYMNRIHKKDGKPRYSYRDDELALVK